MKFKFHQRVLQLAVFVLCVMPFAAFADGTTPQTFGEHFAEGNKFFRADNKDKAIFHYNESIKMRDNAPAYLMRGTVFSLKKDYDKALADLNKAIQIDPQEYAAYFRRSDIYGLTGKNDLAEADKKEGIRIFRAKPASTAKDHYERGIYFEERAFWGDAINEYSLAIKLDPNLKAGFPFTGVYQKRGELYELTNEYKEALEDYTRSLTARPQNVDLLLKRADLLPIAFEDFIDRSPEAIRDYSAVIARAADLKLVPEKLQHAYKARMYLYEKRKEYDAAIADCTELLKLNPQNAHFFFQRGRLYSDKKDYEKAIRDYDQAILLDPSHEDYYNLRGVAYHNLNQYDKAIADYNKAIELYPKFYSPYFNRGLIYDNRKDWANAAADFGKASELRPKDINSLNNRAVAYINQKQWDMALADLNLAIETNPKSANTYNTRGAVYYNKGELDKAIADLTQAITLDSKLVLAYKNRAIAYRQQNKITEAEADEKKVKELSP